MDRLFVVTGGSRGIGASIAHLAARQYPVVITYRNRDDEARRVVTDIEASGGRAWALRVDVGDDAGMIAAFKQIDALGSIAVLVNNAGITGGAARVEQVSADTLQEVMRVNVCGAFIAAREAVKRMSTKNGGLGGVIINVSSGASVMGSPNTWVHYAASKGAIDTMTIGLAKEVAGEGIRVNAIRPGIIDTEIQKDRPADLREQIVATIPIGRMGSAHEMAEAVLWLASPAASYVTGALLDARGGM